MSQQKTIAKVTSISGVGLHSGNTVDIKLKPAETDTGIVFRRIDFDKPLDIDVCVNNITESHMCSVLKSDTNNIKVFTIEHLMSTFAAFQIDNIIVETNAPEIPILDGSSWLFSWYLKEAGTVKQNAVRRKIKVLKKVIVNDNDCFAEVTPADETCYSFKIHWNHPVIKNTPDFFRFSGNLDSYIENISKARTFGFIDKLEELNKKNLALGASIENVIALSDNGIINPEGLRYPNEFVKHKILDAIGDFYVGGSIIGHFNCYKSGHNMNNRLLRKLFNDKKAWTVF